MWPVILLLVSFGFVLLELVLPSGGLLSLLAVLSALSAIFAAFQTFSSDAALLFTGGTVLLSPVVIALAFRIWPHTPMGKKIFIPRPEYPNEVLPDRTELRQLVGLTGITKSKMLPAGAVQVKGRTIDAITEGMAIGSGQVIEIIAIRGNTVVVQPTDGVPDVVDSSQATTAKPDSVAESAFDVAFPDPFDDASA